jgi:nicotinamidase-related amidase
MAHTRPPTRRDRRSGQGRAAPPRAVCVRYSAEDAHAHGFEVVVIEDACRGIDVDGSVEATRRQLAELDIEVIESGQVLAQ